MEKYHVPPNLSLQKPHKLLEDDVQYNILPQLDPVPAILHLGIDDIPPAYRSGYSTCSRCHMCTTDRSSAAAGSFPPPSSHAAVLESSACLNSHPLFVRSQWSQGGPVRRDQSRILGLAVTINRQPTGVNRAETTAPGGQAVKGRRAERLRGE